MVRIQSWYTGGPGPEQDCQRCFTDGLNQSKVFSVAHAQASSTVFFEKRGRAVRNGPVDRCKVKKNESVVFLAIFVTCRVLGK